MPHQLQVSPSGAATAESVDSDSIDPDPALELPAMPIPSRSEYVRYWSELCDREGESPAAAQPIAGPIEPAPFSGSPLPSGHHELDYWRGLWGRCTGEPLGAEHPMAEPGEGEPIVILAEVDPDFLARKNNSRRLRRLTTPLLTSFLPYDAVERRKIIRGAAVLVRMRNGEKVDCECGGPDGCVLTPQSGQLFSRLPEGDAASGLQMLELLEVWLDVIDYGLEGRPQAPWMDRTQGRPGHLRLVD